MLQLRPGRKFYNIPGLGPVFMPMSAAVVPVLPFDYVFSGLGELPAGLIGSGASLSGGNLIITPTGTELITDANIRGFEGTYVAGLAPGWAKVGSPTTVAEENTIIHGGIASQKVVGANNQGVSYTTGSQPSGLYKLETWVYVTTSVTHKLQVVLAGAGNLGATAQAIGPATTWLRKKSVGIRASANTVAANLTGGTGHTAYWDDASIKVLDFASTIAVVQANTQNVWIRGHNTFLSSGQANMCGVCACVDSPTNPANGIFALSYYNGAVHTIAAVKVVSGVWTLLFSSINTSVYSAGAPIELITKVIDGNLYCLLGYNGMYADLAIVSDAAILAGTYAGAFYTDPDDTCSRLRAQAAPAITTVASPATVTPTLVGDNVIVNGTFDDADDWTAAPGTAWSIANGVATKSPAAGGYLNANVGPLTAYKWYRATWDSAWRAGGAIYPEFTALSWMSGAAGVCVSEGRASGTGLGIRGFGSADGDIDNLDIREIAESSMMGTPIVAAADGWFGVGVTSNIGGVYVHFGGLVVCLDDETNPLNYLMAYPVGSNAIHLLKCVNGVKSTLINGSITYGGGLRVAIKKTTVAGSSTVTLYYNNAQVGTPQTVNDNAIIYNTKHCHFATNPRVTFGRLSIVEIS